MPKSTTPAVQTARQALSVRTRFNIFKRDEFQCRYCGRRSPAVVLQVDHVVPVCDGGDDDPLNLVTSCWDCNAGKSGVPLSAVLTGEDPHDRAIAILEQERQIREYNIVRAEARERREADAWALLRFWENDPELATYNRNDVAWLVSTLEWCPSEIVRGFMSTAIARGITQNLRWVKVCLRNERESWEVTRG